MASSALLIPHNETKLAVTHSKLKNLSCRSPVYVYVVLWCHDFVVMTIKVKLRIPFV